MTVIATDGRTMAGDTMTSFSGEIGRFAPKIHQLKDGRIAGACGITTECIKLIRWLDEGGDRPDLSEDVAGIVLNLDGDVVLNIPAPSVVEGKLRDRPVLSARFR